MKYNTGFFKVVETKTGKVAYAPNFLGEDWAYGVEDVDDAAEWVIDSDGDLFLLHNESERVYRPPYGKFRVLRGTGGEFGWKHILYEGDHVVLENSPDHFFHGTVKYGKFFTISMYISLYVGWYIEWDSGTDLDESLAKWALSTSARVHFFSPEEYKRFKDDREGREKAEVQKEESHFLNSLDMERTEQYIDIPSEEEIVNAFHAEEAGFDPDIAKLLKINCKYRSGDYKRREELFSLLDKKMQNEDYAAAKDFMDTFDYWFDDALEIKREWAERKREKWRLFGILT